MAWHCTRPTSNPVDVLSSLRCEQFPAFQKRKKNKKQTNTTQLFAILGDFSYNWAVFIYIRLAGKNRHGRLPQNWTGFELIVRKKCVYSFNVFSLSLFCSTCIFSALSRIPPRIHYLKLCLSATETLKYHVHVSPLRQH